MSASREMAAREPHPPEVHETEEIKAIVDIVNQCQVIYETVQSLEKKFDDMDNKVTKIYYSRARSFWNYPPLRSVSRKYNYLKSKRFKRQRVGQFIHDNSITYPESYSPTSPVRTRDEDSQENNGTIDYTQTFQYSNSIDNAQTAQYHDSIGNTQMSQYPDSIDNTESIQNTENDAVFHSDNSQEVTCVSSSPERASQESPLSPVYIPQTYQEYCECNRISGYSTMPHYSDFENPSLDTITSSTPTMMKERTLPKGELIPIQNPEMKRLALLEAQRTPVIDPNTFGLSPKCTNTVVRHLGKPLNWSVNDVITFLNRLDPPLADELYPAIREHDIDGKALLLLSIDVMIKYMRMKVGVAMKLSNYIQKLKEGVNCNP